MQTRGWLAIGFFCLLLSLTLRGAPAHLGEEDLIQHCLDRPFEAAQSATRVALRVIVNLETMHD